MVEIPTAEPNLVENGALVPDAPAPVFPYSPKYTLLVRSSPEFQILQPAELMTLDMDVRWNTTRAYCLHGRPR